MLVEYAELHGRFSLGATAPQCDFGSCPRQTGRRAMLARQPCLPTARCALNQLARPADGEPLFNPLSPEVIADPYQHFHRLRSIEPMHRSPLGFLVASRHADIAQVLRDKRLGKDFVGRMTRRFGSRIMNEPVYRSMSHWMLQQDPPDHTRLRGLVVKAF